MNRLPAVRERTEDLERASLSTWATLASETKGRDISEEPDALRTAFQADRDRILHSSAFRRLKHKSHLVLGDGHRRTRATHALEVAQIARTIGRGLRLNEDLIEAIALGHDLGNTAFGPAGEEALSMFTVGPFRHEEQSLRVVERLENAGAGLNLTWEVRDGILNHREDTPVPATLEGQAVRIADEIATATHDVADTIRAGVLAPDEILGGITAPLGSTCDERLSALIRDVITESADHPELAMSPRVEEALHALTARLHDAVERNAAAASDHTRAVHCLSSLAVYLLSNPGDDAGDPLTGVCDTLSAYTDAQVLSEFGRHFLPS